MTCDRCGKPTRGVGYAIHMRHRDDPKDQRHVLCLDCNPAYEEEEARWVDSHPIPFADGMTLEEKRAAIRRSADERHHHMRDWLSKPDPG